jgi:hypothetical protein
MTKHLGYSLIGGLLFLAATVIILWFSDTGIYNGFEDAISRNPLFRSSLKTSFWIGVLAGGISSIVLRKSINSKVYVWIALIFTLILTEFVIATLV